MTWAFISDIRVVHSGTRTAEHKACSWDMQLFDGCSFKLYVAKCKLYDVWHKTKLNSTFNMQRLFQGNDIHGILAGYHNLHYITRDSRVAANHRLLLFRQDDPDAHDRFLKISRAYEVLKDDDLRKKYDTHGEDGLKEDGPSGRGYQSWNFYNQQFG